MFFRVEKVVAAIIISYTDTIKNDVAPTLKNVLKSSLNAVFTGVPRVIKQVTCLTPLSVWDYFLNFPSQLSHEAHDAAKVFSGNYQSTLKDIQNSDIISQKRKEKKQRDL